MANNYTPSYNQYLTQTAGYALPSSVRTYSVFDPASNSWRRMTNDGRSPMPVQSQTPVMAVQPMTSAQEQAAVAGALAQARQTQGKVWNPLPQTPVQIPSGGSGTASNRQPRGGMGVSSSQPSASPRGASMSPGETVAYSIAVQNPGADLQTHPRVFMPLESPYEKFQQEIPRSNAYGPLQNPREARSMSPDYRAPAAAVSPAVLTAAGRQIPAADFPEYADRPITRDLLRLGRGFKRLFSRPSMAEEAVTALRANTGLPPLR